MTETKEKRPAEQEDDEDVGPALPPSKPKKQRTLPLQSVFMENLPSCDSYERSLMHRDVVNFLSVTPFDFIITTSIDGYVKFWKKQEGSVEFVKQFRAHLGSIVAAATSWDGMLFASASADKDVKVFDVQNFDMINILKLDFLLRDLCWIYQKNSPEFSLAWFDRFLTLQQRFGIQ